MEVGTDHIKARNHTQTPYLLTLYLVIKSEELLLVLINVNRDATTKCTVMPNLKHTRKVEKPE